MPRDSGGPEDPQYDYHVDQDYTGVDPTVEGFKGQNPDPKSNEDYTIAGHAGDLNTDRPVPTNMVPTTGPAAGGTTVQIDGTNFYGATVEFGVPGNMQPVTDLVINADGTSLTCVTPPGPVSPPAADVTITNNIDVYTIPQYFVYT